MVNFQPKSNNYSDNDINDEINNDIPEDEDDDNIPLRYHMILLKIIIYAYFYIVMQKLNGLPCTKKFLSIILTIMLGLQRSYLRQ